MLPQPPRGDGAPVPPAPADAPRRPIATASPFAGRAAGVGREPGPPGRSPRRGAGRWIGPIQVTPFVAIVSVVLVVATATIGVAIVLIRDTNQIPLVMVAVAVIGLDFVAMSVGGAIRMGRAWQDGDQRDSVVFALLGGIAGMIALGCFGAVLVLALASGAG